MDIARIIETITVLAIPLVLAITLHEAAHAYAAKHFGDRTAYMLGRMTLNPVRHIDPVWTILVPLVTFFLAGFAFGAAKPVPVNADAMRNPKRDMIWVAAAGPAANLAMMVAWAVVGKILINFPASLPLAFVLQVAQAGIMVNALLMVFNLFPLLPLDGGRIVAGLLPDSLAYQWSRLEPYGMLILVALLVSGLFSAWLGPLVEVTLKALYSVFGF